MVSGATTLALSLQEMVPDALSPLAAPALLTTVTPKSGSQHPRAPLLAYLSPTSSDIQSYLSLPAVQDAIGVDPAVRGNFSINSWRVSLEFIAGLDFYSYRADHYLAALLERGVRVLVYVGSNDFVANWVRPGNVVE